ncbi:MAG: hypothetical protein AAF533_00890 [Acidobacteriota bacterium]
MSTWREWVRRALVSGCLVVASVTIGRAQPGWVAVARLMPEAEDSEFGRSVALDGDTLVVEHGTGPYREGLRIFERDSSSGEWLSSRSLDVGTSPIALDGDRLVLGGSGVFHVRERDAGGSDNWGLVTEVPVPEVGGYNTDVDAIDVSGDRVVVGVPSDGNPWTEFPGAAFVFERQPDASWELLAELTMECGLSNGFSTCSFGRHVAIDGERLVVGAPATDDWDVPDSALFFHEADAGGSGAWGRTQTIVGSTERPLGLVSLELEGDLVVAGSIEGEASWPWQGRVELFEHDGSRWLPEAVLHPQEPNPADMFGFQVALDGRRVVVASRRDLSLTGRLHLYEEESGEWVSRALLTTTPEPRPWLASYGSSMAADGARLVITSDLADWTVDLNVVHVFERPEVDCTNSLDDDEDGRVDCFDADCAWEPGCEGNDPDGDGRPSSEDCAPGDATAWVAPDEVMGLTIARGPRLTLEWSPVTPADDSTLFYQVAEGDLLELVDTPLRIATTVDGASARAYLDRTEGPRAYLVTALNSCGAEHLNWGRDSRGTDRSVDP